MSNDLKNREHWCEQLSALADGEVRGEAFTQALDYAHGEGMADWRVYHLVGDVLRSQDLAAHGQSDLLARVRAQMAQEPSPLSARPAPAQAAPLQAVVAPAAQAAANDAVFRWKALAGLASVAAVAAIGWSMAAALGSGPAPGAQWAAAPAPGAPIVAVAEAPSAPDGQAQVMLRDARLDELLAAHKQYGNASALQMPAGFLRNATFETPAR